MNKKVKAKPKVKPKAKKKVDKKKFLFIELKKDIASVVDDYCKKTGISLYDYGLAMGALKDTMQNPKTHTHFLFLLQMYFFAGIYLCTEHSGLVNIKKMDLKKIEGVTALQKENINLALAPADVAESNMRNIKEYMEVVLAISQEDVKTLEGVFEKLTQVQQKMIDSTAAQAQATQATAQATQANSTAGGNDTYNTGNMESVMNDIRNALSNPEGLLVQTKTRRGSGQTGI